MVSFLQKFTKKQKDDPQNFEGEAAKENEEAEVLINFSNQFSQDDIYQNVKEAVSKKPSVLNIELIGAASIPQDLCLSLWHLLTQVKDPKTTLVVNCNANLINGQILILLAADVRKIRPRSWMEISSLKKCEQSDATRGGWVKQFGFQSDEPYFLTDYRIVFSILNQYLPCELLSKDRVDIQKTFKEYGLCLSNDEEAQFKKLFEAEVDCLGGKDQSA